VHQTKQESNFVMEQKVGQYCMSFFRKLYRVQFACLIPMLSREICIRSISTSILLMEPSFLPGKMLHAGGFALVQDMTSLIQMHA